MLRDRRELLDLWFVYTNFNFFIIKLVFIVSFERGLAMRTVASRDFKITGSSSALNSTPLAKAVIFRFNQRNKFSSLCVQKGTTYV